MPPGPSSRLGYTERIPGRILPKGRRSRPGAHRRIALTNGEGSHAAGLGGACRMARRTKAKGRESAQRYYQPVLRPWGADDRLVLADLLLDGHEPGEIARILNRYL